MTGEAENKTRIENARLDWDANAPRSIFFGDIYFSGEGLAETRHVFLAGNDLPRRFAAARNFAIGELGFGTGLNFLASWALWNATKKQGARLVYYSVEAFPLAAADLARAHAAWPELAELSARLRALAPPPVAGFHRLEIAPDVALILGFGDARQMLSRAEGLIDSWFLDGFAPAKNPDMWSPEIFAEMARRSRPGATFATYSVAGEARRALAAAGFAVAKAQGFARKKEMLKGAIAAPPAPAARRAPWFDGALAPRLGHGARLGIIGGGIAGASLAFAARAAGLDPVIIERSGLGAGASGNPAGLVMPRLDLGGGAAAEFHLCAFLHTIRLLSDFPSAFNPWGALLGAVDAEERARQKKILDARLLPDGWIEARADGLFFPQAGIVDPKRFVAALAGDCEILARRAVRLRAGERPEIEFSDGARARFDAIVLANGIDALAFHEARSLPLMAIAGQIDWFPDAKPPPFAVAFGPYAAAAPKGGLVIGATYERTAPGAAPATSRAATRANIAAIAQALPEVAAALDPAASLPRASIRCQTPDRLPVVGALPDWSFYGAAYDGLRRGRAGDYPPAEAVHGLYILAGLGSRGLVTAPLAAALLIAQMTGAVAPLARDVAEALHPARFFIRDLKRARPTRKD